MLSPDRIFQWIEVDMPQCTNTFGSYTLVPVSAPSVTKNDGDTITSGELTRNADITASFTITVPASPLGVIWEQGGNAGGVYLGFTGPYLVLRAGGGAFAPNAQTAYYKTLSSKYVGKTLQIVVRIDVSDGAIYLTVIEAGQVLLNTFARTSSGSFVGGEWAGTESGAIGLASSTVPAGESSANYNGTISNVRFWNSLFSPQTGCTARLFNRNPEKCWQMRADCGDLPSFTLGTPITLRFCHEEANPPKDGNIYFPVLSRRIQMSSGTVNIAGSDPNMSGLGKQSTLSFDVEDFRYHERGLDKYVSERLSGAALFSGVGYDPEQYLYLSKLKSRWLNYPDAAVRYCNAYIRDGVVVEQQTRHFYLKDWTGPNGQTHSFKCRGVLNFMDKATALAPKPSVGLLSTALTDIATSFTMTPAGVGDANYPASGEICIGNEVMSFTRAGDVMTVVRGIANTLPRSHTIGATVQIVLKYVNARPDDVMNDLVDNYTDTPDAYLRTAVRDANAAEIDRWATAIRLNTRIVTPTPVGTLVGELSDLGFIIWENEVDQSLNLRANRPFEGGPRIVTDRTIKEIKTKENEDRRLTQVRFLSKRFDPTKQLSDENNYEIKVLRVDPKAFTLFGAVRNKNIFTRWLDQGDLNSVNIITLRYLNRFSRAPKTWELTLDADEQDVSLAEVIQMETDQSPDSNGLVGTQLVQVFERDEPIPFHEVKVTCQSYQFSSKYAVIAPNTVPVYGLATDQQKTQYAFISSDENGFDSDGAEPYRII